jgi:nitrate/nitrite-specific signal transduction histidine kinase
MSEDKKKVVEQGSDDDYREYVRKRLAVIAPVIEKVSLGEFTGKIQIPEGVEDEFTELLVGLNLMIDDLRFMFEENRRNTDELQRRLTELSIFNEIGRALGSTLQLSQLLEVIYTQTGRVMVTDNFYIALYDEKSNMIDFPLFIDEGKRLDMSDREAGSSLTGHIIRTRKPLLIKEGVVLGGSRAEVLAWCAYDFSRGGGWGNCGSEHSGLQRL